jgi:hypothetical protein
VKVTASATLTHNPCGEAYWASGLRENLTSRSYGEGLETGRAVTQVPRQSFTRQRLISRHKRILGATLRARQWSAQKQECLVRILTHNVMILRCRLRFSTEQQRR